MSMPRATDPAVLVVEGDPSVQGPLCRALQHHGFAPLHAGTVEAALKILGQEHIEAVILDLGLPDRMGFKRSGLSLLAYLRFTPDYETLPVLILTGQTLAPEDEDLVRGYRADVFYKPHAYDALMESLNRLTLQHPPAA